MPFAIPRPGRRAHLRRMVVTTANAGATIRVNGRAALRINPQSPPPSTVVDAVLTAARAQGVTFGDRWFRLLLDDTGKWVLQMFCQNSSPRLKHQIRISASASPAEFAQAVEALVGVAAGQLPPTALLENKV